MAFTSSGLFRLLMCFGAYIIFLAFGATVFSAIEGPEEKEQSQYLRDLRFKFLEDHSCLKDADLENLLVEVVNAANRGVSAVRNATGEPNWSFGQSIFFSTTVLTTIGYGHVTPLSRAGKFFCMIFASIGIPFTILVLGAVASRVNILSMILLEWLTVKLGELYKALTIKLVHLLLLGIVVFTLTLFIPAGIFAYLEPDWDYADGFYYCFISLTTIGLGDYIPGDSPDQPNRALYKFGATGYLFMGEVLMMIFLGTLCNLWFRDIAAYFTPPVDQSHYLLPNEGSESSMGLRYGYNSTSNTQMEENEHRRVVRVRSRRDDSPNSPDESAQMVKDLKLY